MSTTLSVHPTTPNVQTVSPLAGALELVKKVFQFATTSRLGIVAETEVWQLYRMTGGRDSVPAAVHNELSKIAAVK